MDGWPDGVVAHLMLLSPVIAVVLLIQWAFVHWILRQNILISFIATLGLAAGSTLIAYLFALSLNLAAPTPQNFTAEFQMGLEGLGNLFFLFFLIWLTTYALSVGLLVGAYRLLNSEAPPISRISMGIVWATFFSAPLLTYLAWLFQY